MDYRYPRNVQDIPYPGDQENAMATIENFRPYLDENDKHTAELIQAKMRIAGFHGDSLADVTSMALTCLAEGITPVLQEVTRTSDGIPETIKRHIVNGIMPPDKDDLLPY